MSEEFQILKAILCSKIVLSSFNPEWETKLLVDSLIKFGIGYVLIQVDKEGNIHVIRCRSRGVTKSWSFLLALECETAGICWAVHHCRSYLKGCPAFTMVTYHLPLVKLFTGSLEKLSPKLFKIVTELQDYNFTVSWVAGKSHLFVDSLGQVPQLEGFNPLTGGTECDLESGGKYGLQHTANNVTHLDNDMGIQITALVMKEVKDDQLYQKILMEFGTRSKRGLRELPCDHLAQAQNNMWDGFAQCPLPKWGGDDSD